MNILEFLGYLFLLPFIAGAFWAVVALLGGLFATVLTLFIKD